MVRIDHEAALLIRQSGAEFRAKYGYPEPEREKNIWDKRKKQCKGVSEWCKEGREARAAASREQKQTKDPLAMMWPGTVGMATGGTYIANGLAADIFREWWEKRWHKEKGKLGEERFKDIDHDRKGRKQDAKDKPPATTAGVERVLDAAFAKDDVVLKDKDSKETPFDLY